MLSKVTKVAWDNYQKIELEAKIVRDHKIAKATRKYNLTESLAHAQYMKVYYEQGEDKPKI